MEKKVGIIIPCYNEELTITKVIKELRGIDPSYRIYVFDNNSTDASAELAKKAGAEVFSVRRQGKGEVIRQAFADIEADIYVIIDADCQYESEALPRAIIKFNEENLDMLSLVRKIEHDKVHRLGHSFGNRMITYFIALFFGRYCTDVLSGYRIFSKRFVKSFPAHSRGFEIEVELSIFALQMRMAIAEMDTVYKSRPEGSFSKLHTVKDGFRILWMIFLLIFTERPFFFFSILSAILTALSLFLGWGLWVEFLATSRVARFPTAFLAVGLAVSALLFFATGLIIHVLRRSNAEQRRLAFNNIPLEY